MAKRLELCEVHSLSTSRQRPTVSNVCFTLLRNAVIIISLLDSSFLLLHHQFDRSTVYFCISVSFSF